MLEIEGRTATDINYIIHIVALRFDSWCRNRTTLRLHLPFSKATDLQRLRSLRPGKCSNRLKLLPDLIKRRLYVSRLLSVDFQVTAEPLPASQSL